MVTDGWWWSSPQLTHKSIQKRVLRETISVLLGRDRKRRRPLLDAQPVPVAAMVEIPRPESSPHDTTAVAR